ncbi:MAG TPA: tetratricopeptide repeat protein [Tepidisphaeraceae bacterium]|jgi:tetratricopeptide (TPR) repeat protein|nr:tetratricopeptide repeat protein [Tepidisphaeraceae bacterium]
MNKAITFACLASFLCACSSHNNSATQAQRLNQDPANLPLAKDPPLKANTRFAAGQLDESQGKVDAAIHQYNAALEIDSTHLPSLYRLGVIYAEQKNYDKSIEIWHQYLTVSNNAPEGYGNLGYCYELAGNPKLAEATYQKGIEKDANNAGCRTNYGLMLARKGRIQEAVRMWNPVLTQAEIHYNLASIYLQGGRKQEAKAEYQHALNLDPTMIDARARLSDLGSD